MGPRRCKNNRHLYRAPSEQVKRQTLSPDPNLTLLLDLSDKLSSYCETLAGGELEQTVASIGLTYQFVASAHSIPNFN